MCTVIPPKTAHKMLVKIQYNSYIELDLGDMERSKPARIRYVRMCVLSCSRPRSIMLSTAHDGMDSLTAMFSIGYSFCDHSVWGVAA